MQVKNISVKELAEKLNVKSPTVSQYLRGDIRASTAIAIAKALGVEVGELFVNPLKPTCVSNKDTTQPIISENTFKCPHCGKPISVSK